MEHLLEESVSSADLKRFETRYHEEMAGGKVTPSAQFEYAWCLVRSKYPADIRKGILLLEDLYQVCPRQYRGALMVTYPQKKTNWNLRNLIVSNYCTFAEQRRNW